jgi:NADPH:quinone reductase-like Zn-dependent oxidoreductase
LERLVGFCEQTGIRPTVDSVIPLAEARSGLEKLASGDLFGKIVLIP